MSTSNDTLVNKGVNSLSLEKAALYYSKYVRVFPLSPNTKIPLLPGSWTAYATQDPIIIISWWQSHPNANIALVADTNVTIIDLDIKDGKDGVTSFRTLISQMGISLIDLQPPIVTTTSGGKHVIFKHPNDKHPSAFHNGTDRGEFRGIDVRSGNAYVVASPSIVDGKGYSWSNDDDPLLNIPTLPDKLSKQLDEWGISNVIDISEGQPKLLAETPRHDEHPINQLPQHLLEFALHGHATHYAGDNSAALMGLASRLYILGLTDAEVLTFLANYPGPSAVAFKRRRGSFESAVSWLWKYSCIKARSNRKMSNEEVTDTFLAVPSACSLTDTPNEHAEAPDLSGIESIEDFGIARDYIKYALGLPPLEQGAAIGTLKSQVKWLGINGRAVDQEIKLQETAMRAEFTSTRGGPVFPHMSENDAIRATTHNFQAVMQHHGIGIKHNTMSHDYDIYIPGGTKWLSDTQANDQRTLLRDMLEQYGMPSGRIDEYVSLVGGQNAYHPVIDMLKDVEWDGEDRLTPVLNSLELAYGDKNMRDKLVTTWLVSALTVVGNYGNNPPRGVLVLAGPQHCGKTSFFRAITPPLTFGEGLHLDVHDKDSLKKAVKYWIVELGELDSTFRKSDIAALKAHISNTMDEIRLPYAAKESCWQRRTVYGATVNRVDFLQDYTGNTRFWPVEVSNVDVPVLNAILSGEGLTQFWAQLMMLKNSGHPYLLSQSEVKMLEEHNDSFREVKMEEEILRATFDWDLANNVPMTVREICGHCGMRTDLKGRNPMTEPLQVLTGQTRSLSMRRGKGTAPDRCWMMPPLKVLGLTDQGEE